MWYLIYLHRLSVVFFISILANFPIYKVGLTHLHTLLTLKMKIKSYRYLDLCRKCTVGYIPVSSCSCSEHTRDSSGNHLRAALKCYSYNLKEEMSHLINVSYSTPLVIFPLRLVLESTSKYNSGNSGWELWIQDFEWWNVDPHKATAPLWTLYWWFLAPST